MKNINRRIKLIAASVLALAMIVALHAPVLPVYAGGSAVVTLASADGLDSSAEFTFNLYKIGSWTHTSDGKAVLSLDSDLATKAMVSPTISYDGTDEQAEALLNSSNTVGNYIKANSGDFTSVGTKTISPGESVTFSGLTDNGLYILVGDTTQIDKKYWTPKSVYIDILDGTKEMTINMVKFEAAPVVDEYTVIKMWDADEADKDAESKSRPESIQVKIKYGDVEVDTVTLNEENNWSYSWKSDESDGTSVIYSNDTHAEEGKVVISERLSDDNDWTYTFDGPDTDKVWHVEEVSDSSLSRYTADVTDPTESTPGRFTVTNTYSTTELEITKNLDAYVDGGEASNLTIAFKITGKIGDEVVYTNYAGISFGKEDDASKSVTVTGIPVNLDSIEVEEVYSAGYSPKDNVKVITEKDPDTNTWKVTFDNTHDGPHGGSGVVNKYVDGNFDDQEGLTTESE